MALASRLLPVFVALILLEGPVRKLLPGQPAEVMLVKDVFAVCLYVLFFFQWLGSKELRARLAPLSSHAPLGLCLICLGPVVTAAIVSILSNEVSSQVFVLGVREYFLYVPLVPLVFDYCLDDRRRLRMIRTLVIVGLFAGVGAIWNASEIFQVPLLEPIENHLTVHSSDFGDYGFQSSFFDVPERFAAFALFVLVFSIALSFESSAFERILFSSTALITWASLFLSARRVAFLVGSLVAVLLILWRRGRRTTGAATLAVVALVLWPLMALLNSTLASVFSREAVVEDSSYYLSWAVADIQRALGMAPSLFHGFFGITSGGTIQLGLPQNISGLIEATWSKAVLSLGAAGALSLAVAQSLLIICLVRATRRDSSGHTAATTAFVIGVTLWNIKSGEYLVWAPLTMLTIAFGLAAASAVKAGQLLDSAVLRGQSSDEETHRAIDPQPKRRRLVSHEIR